MNVRLAILALTLLPASAASATTVSIDLVSGYQIPILSTGLNGSNLGTYLITPGSCTATSCIWTGSYTSSNPAYASGDYSIVTTLGNVSESLIAVEDTVGGDTAHVTGTASDITMVLTLTPTGGGSSQAFYFITNGVLDGSLDITGFPETIGSDQALYCSADCSISALANKPGEGWEGRPYVTFSFDDGNTVGLTPEPSSLALLGTGTLTVSAFLRRRIRR